MQVLDRNGVQYFSLESEFIYIQLRVLVISKV